MTGYFGQLDPKTPEQLAAAAIRQTLILIRNGMPVASSFASLTAALAALEHRPVDEVRAMFRPTATRQEPVK